MAASPKLPSAADLRRQVQFSSSDGRIWLAGQRMVLMHAASLGALRRELIQSMGLGAARRMLLRVGYAAGERAAALARQLRAKAGIQDMFMVGPQLHMLEGIAQVTPERLEIDPSSGRFLAVFRWDHSWEVETHVRAFGLQGEPVCWSLLGYASGYTSAFMGRTVLYKEVMCGGCGDAHCRIEGRPLEEWPDGEEMAHDYEPDAMARETQDTVWPLQAQAEDRPVSPNDALGLLIGKSASFMAATDLLRKAASTQVTVLLTGETGVGKERFARALHALSSRSSKPFVAVNCAALPADLVESELFGAEKGAYTGADAARPGRFERAHGGTLFLDELGELPLSAQAKLLRVLQEGEVERLGAIQVRPVDVRLVAATHLNLSEAVRAGRFREDLYYRLNVYPICIPPLRDRPEDIELFARDLLERFAQKHDKYVAGLTDRALDALRHYAWPGNVRELENRIERSVILVDIGQPVDVDQLFAGDLQAPGSTAAHTVQASGRLGALHRPLGDSGLVDRLLSAPLDLQALEAQLIEEAVLRNQGNLAAAARQLSLTRPQISYRLGKIRSARS